MSAKRFKITLADGSAVTGAVHGCGGIIDGRDGLDRVKAAIRAASEGDRIGLYEPREGHIVMYPTYTARWSKRVEVDVRGAISVEEMRS